MSAIETPDLENAPVIFWKHLFDRVSSALLIIMLLPIGILISLLIKLESSGTIFFCHTRVGQGGRHFKMFKFRTMVKDAHLLGPGLTAQDDPRITRLGRILRRTSLDELPQLINVLLGDMSIVGPRPEIPEIVLTYSDEQRRALSVKPGITGLSQINGRDDLPLPQKLAFDLAYVEQISFYRELQILWKTIPAIVSGKGNRC